MPEVTIAEMVRNGTMSAEMAAVIWAAVDEKVSFLTAAIPRFAGKTTTSNAALALRRPDVPLTWIDGTREQTDELVKARKGGYLAVAEFEQAPMPGYIWGEPVRRVFQTAIEAGYSLQAVLHASSVEEAISEVVRGNGVTDQHCGLFKLVLYIERLGSYGNYSRRLHTLYEMDRVEDGKPVGRSLFRWQPNDDTFEKLAEPTHWGQGAADIASRAEVFSKLAEAGKTAPADVAVALAEFRTKAKV
jgi:hypothetical protein